MALEDVQAGISADGNGRVTWVATLADPGAPTVTELNAGTTKAFTYGLTPDGFRHTPTENTVETGRYTLKQKLSKPGTTSDELEIEYVYEGTDSDVIRVALQPGTKGFIVHRLGIGNEVDYVAGQLVDVFPVEAGRQRRNPGAENSEISITQKLHVTGSVREFVEVVSGA